MLYLLWGLLNIGLSLYFFVICFKATKFIREKLGLLASIIFVLGLLSFNNKPFNLNQNKTWQLALNNSLNKKTTISIVQLEKTWISRYDLNVEFGKDIQEQSNVPIRAYFSTTGLISGTDWKPMTVDVNKTKEDGKFDYFVWGSVEWKLLGITIYNQHKEYRGIISTK